MTMQVTLTPPAALLAAARGSVADGKKVAARALVEAARRLHMPPEEHDELALIDGRLLLGAGKVAEAVSLLARAVDRSPRHWRLRCLAAKARLAADDAAGSAAEAAQAVLLAPAESAPKAALGTALLALGQLPDAVGCLAEAVAARPLHIEWRLTLSRARAVGADVASARTTLMEGLALLPGVHPWRHAAMKLAILEGDLPAALALADAVHVDGNADAAVLRLRADLLSCLGHEAAAGVAWHEALQAGPEDRYVRHMAASAGWVAPAARLGPEEVRTIFEGFAWHYDAFQTLHADQGPALVRAALLRHLPGLAGGKDAGTPLPLLDIGCGTGRVAAFLRDLPAGEGRGPWTGIDLSAAMLAEAASKQLYTALIEGDVCRPGGLAALRTGAPFGLAIGAGILPWVAHPLPLFSAVAKLLRPDSLFVLTAETPPAAGGSAPSTGRTARFRHHPDLLAASAAASGWRTLSCEQVGLLHEAGQEVAGCLLVLSRKAFV